MAGVAGFEPTIARPKPAALPLGYTPIFFKFYQIYVILSITEHNFNPYYLTQGDLKTVQFQI